MAVDIKAKYGSCSGFNVEGRLGDLTLPTPPESPKEDVFSFSEPDNDSNIVFGEVVDGRPTIKGGSLEKLVERVTYEKYPDPVFTQTFLLTYRTFTTPNQLLNILRARYNMKAPPGVSEGEFEKTLKPIRLRVFNVLRNWLLKGFHDFVDNNKLRNSFQQFVKEDISVSMANAASSLLKVFDRQMNEAKTKREVIFSTTPPAPILPKNLTAAPTLLDFHPEEIARQLTLIESQLYRAIKPWECLGQAWAKKDKERRAPRVMAMINRFNQVSNWVATAVVQAESMKHRLNVLKHVIEVAHFCRQLNNFNGIMEVISGLHASAIYRLKQTWAALDSKHTKMLEELQAVMCRDQNFKSFRAHLHSSDPPCIPYLGVYLTDLTFIEDGNNDELKGGLINFVKRQQVSQVIAEIQQYQHTPYCLVKVELIADWLNAVEALSEEECYKESLLRESRGGGTPGKASSNPGSSVRRRGLTRSQSLKPQSPFASPYGELEEIKGYRFYETDSDKNIQVHKVENREIIKAGTLAKLVERLTFEKYPDTSYLAAFMMTYKTFTTANELLDLLIMRFNMPHPKSPTKEQEKKFKSEKLIPIHFRVFNVLKTWVDKYFLDFKEDTVLVQRVFDFVDKAVSVQKVLEKAGSQIKSCLNKKLETTIASSSLTFRLGEEFRPNTPVPSNVPAYNINDLDIVGVAKQLFLTTMHAFQQLASRECLQKAWTSPEARTKSPNLRLLTQNFNLIQRWVKSELVKVSGISERTEIVTVFVNLADKLAKLRDFHDCHAIIDCLELMRLEELAPTWQYVPQKTITVFQRLMSQINGGEWDIRANNFKGRAGSIALLQPMVRSLRKIEENMPDSMGPLVNFEKRQAIYNKFAPLAQMQQLPFAEASIPDNDKDMTLFLTHLEIQPEDALTAALSQLDNTPPASAKTVTTSKSPDGAVKQCLLEMLDDDPAFKEQLVNEIGEEVKASLRASMKESVQRFAGVIRQFMEVAAAGSDGAKVRDAVEMAVAHAFPDASFDRWTYLDKDGDVYGWPEEIFLMTVEADDGEEKSLVVDCSYNYTAARLGFFKRALDLFISNSDLSGSSPCVLTAHCGKAVRSAAEQLGIEVLDI